MNVWQGLSKFLTFLPLLLSVLNFALCVPSAVLLKAIHKIDSDAMMEVIEQVSSYHTYIRIYIHNYIHTYIHLHIITTYITYMHAYIQYNGNYYVVY